MRRFTEEELAEIAAADAEEEKREAARRLAYRARKRSQKVDKRFADIDKTIQIAYMLSDEQWARLDAIHKKLRKAGMFDGHSEEEMLRFKMDADQSHYIDFVLTALEQDYSRYFGDGTSVGVMNCT